MKSKIKYVFFDMDGVILDSEPLHCEAKIHLLKSNHVQSQNNLLEYVGVSNDVFWSDIIRKYQLDTDPETMARDQAQLVAEFVRLHNLPASDGLLELMDSLDAKGVKMSVVSSSPRHLVEPVLEYLKIKQRFQVIVTGDDVENVKPAPDLYLLALRKNNIDASKAMAVEDSKFGVQAALTAGIKCVGYENPTSGNQDLSKATHTVTNLTQILDILEKI